MDIGDILQLLGADPAPLPRGLCADREDHLPHAHDSESLGRFWCTADQDQREPWRSERRRRQAS